MSGKTRLKKAVVAVGLSLIGLTGSFNSVAQSGEVPTAPATSAENIVPLRPQAARTPSTLDIRLSATFSSINSYMKLNFKRNPEYQARKDPVIQRRMDEIRSLLDRGANPDAFVGAGIEMAGATDLTVFQAAVALSSVMATPEFLQYFIDKGADVHKLAPDQWSPMDLAVGNFLGAQSITPTTMKENLAIMQVMTRAGARISEAAKVSEQLKKPLRTYADLARNIVAARIMVDQNIMSAEEFNEWNRPRQDKETALRQTVQHTPSLTGAWIKAHGGTLNDFPDAPPGGPEPYISQPGDTLYSIALRFKGVMGVENTAEAIIAIARISNKSGLDAGAEIPEKTNLLIPMPIGRQLGGVTLKEPASLIQLAEMLKKTHYNEGASAQDIAQELALMNNIDPRKILESGLIKKGQPLITAYAADIYRQFQPLTPPPSYKGGREVDLVVIESGGGDSGHNKDTYRVSSNIAYAINPAIDQTQIHSMAEMLLNYPSDDLSDALKMLLDSAGSPMNERVIFSHSMGVFVPGERSLPMRQARDFDGNMLYALIKEYTDRLERSRPIIFTASGNWNPQEARHIQSSAISHSPRSVSIGAAGQYGEAGFMMAPYSSIGADVCAPLPTHLGNQMEGTSFATPLAAAIFRQLDEWYGDKLSFEEIMAAGFMTANRDVNEDPQSANPRATEADLFGVTPEKARYNSNGGGLPNHERCGAGVLDIEKWQAALNRMVTIKQSLSHQAQETKYDITVGAPLVIPGRTPNDKTQYVYRMTIPENMTLGKLTFRLTQDKDKHSEIVVRTPAGFEKQLAHTYTDIFSSFAFAYEDVKAGQVMEIRTTEPLGSDAGMILRGHTPSSTIAVLRDHLRAQGVLPAPLKSMSGNQVLGPSAPVTPIALKDVILKKHGTPLTAPHMPSPPEPAPIPQEDTPAPRGTRPGMAPN